LTESTIQATEKLDRITKLLEEVENKNAQYKWSIETMEHQMKQLEELTNSLQNIVDSKGKEASNE
jgi:chaperonin cofactor prefoldin